MLLTATLPTPLARLAYRAAFRLARCWWWLRPRPGQAAALAVWGEGGLLVVQTSYRPELDFPGGGMKRGEMALACAVRELFEEVGIRAPAAACVPAGTVRFRHDHRPIELVLFAWAPPGPSPVPQPDGAEITGAFYLPAGELLARRLAPGLRLYLEGLDCDAAQPAMPSQRGSELVRSAAAPGQGPSAGGAGAAHPGPGAAADHHTRHGLRRQALPSQAWKQLTTCKEWMPLVTGQSGCRASQARACSAP